MSDLLIKDIFAADITRDIPPVVYTHEQDPEKLASEVGEYVITGGYRDDDPRRSRVRDGIHEQFVHLLRAMAREYDKPRGPELPSCWISGFFGSGKSSFAKLLGLSLDHRKLPDGRTLADALLARDTSPKQEEFRDAWRTLLAHIDGHSISVVFDIGGVARDNEQIHAAIVRQIQKRLGYCANPLVADYELKLEINNEYKAFLEACQAHLDAPWDELKSSPLAEDDFSEVLHHMNPDRFQDPMSWIESRVGVNVTGLSADDAAERITDMLAQRDPDATLFIVVDEVSQYIHQDTGRMLALQSFVSSLGQRLGGKVWLLVTGQEQLDAVSEANTLGKLKDRFPPKLRVHLAPTNIRDVVHKRMLEKSPAHEPALRSIYQQYRQNLRLYAYQGDTISEDDFVETYPMLPGYIELIMSITSALRTRSTRRQGDDQAIRGLIQMIGELFRTQNLATETLGTIVSLDHIYDVQASALDSDTQATMARIFSQRTDPLELRVARAVALLELIQDQQATTVELVTKCLYQDISRATAPHEVRDALERLRRDNLLGYSEKNGYKIQSSAGQDWDNERNKFNPDIQERAEHIRATLRSSMGKLSRPKLNGSVEFPWLITFTDDGQILDVKVLDPHTETNIHVDLHFIPDGESKQAEFQRRSSEIKDRIFWVTGKLTEVDHLAREFARSQHMIKRYQPRNSTLPPEQQMLLIQEKARQEEIAKQLGIAIEDAIQQGFAYVRGRRISPAEHGEAMATSLQIIAAQQLPHFYSSHDSTRVQKKELDQLLEDSLAGLSSKFLPTGIGLIASDEGKFVPMPDGKVPVQVLDFIQQKPVSGSDLFQHFARQPFGYDDSLVLASIAGLLRARKIEITYDGRTFSSYSDSDIKAFFSTRKSQIGADYSVASEADFTRRDLVKSALFFEQKLGMTNVDREQEAIADAVYARFPSLAITNPKVISLYERIARDIHYKERHQAKDGREEPHELASLRKLQIALDKCRSSRQVRETVRNFLRYYDDLLDTVPTLTKLEQQLDEQVVFDLHHIQGILDTQARQLSDLHAHDDSLIPDFALVKSLEDQINAHLDSHDRPWQGLDEIKPLSKELERIYVSTRQAIMKRRDDYVAQTRKEVRLRAGWEKLDKNQSNHVLLPINHALTDTTDEATHPTLLALLDNFEARVDQARDIAHERLDHVLAEADEVIIEVISHQLDNCIITSVQELDRVLEDLRDRAINTLEAGAQVRFKN